MDEFVLKLTPLTKCTSVIFMDLFVCLFVEWVFFRLVNAFVFSSIKSFHNSVDCNSYIVHSLNLMVVFDARQMQCFVTKHNQRINTAQQSNAGFFFYLPNYLMLQSNSLNFFDELKKLKRNRTTSQTTNFESLMAISTTETSNFK